MEINKNNDKSEKSVAEYSKNQNTLNIIEKQKSVIKSIQHPFRKGKILSKTHWNRWKSGRKRFFCELESTKITIKKQFEKLLNTWKYKPASQLLCKKTRRAKRALLIATKGCLLLYVACISRAAGRPAVPPPQKIDFCNFSNMIEKRKHVSRRDEFALQNCTDTVLLGCRSSKKRPIWWKIEILGMSRYVTLCHGVETRESIYLHSKDYKFSD